MPIIDIRFSIQGDVIDIDHAYDIYSAICRQVPWVHGNPVVGIHNINGYFLGNRKLQIIDKSHLVFRIPHDVTHEILPLAGKILHLGSASLQIGIPHPNALTPATELYSRLVVIKGMMDPDKFLTSVQQQLEDKGITAAVNLIKQEEKARANLELGSHRGTTSPFLRRTVRIRDRTLVGFAVNISGLKAQDSLRLQEEGLGGRRHFGCGLFIPTRD